MIKLISTFCLIWFLVAGGITLLRQLNKKELWSLTKTLSYAAVITAVSSLILTLIVILF